MEHGAIKLRFGMLTRYLIDLIASYFELWNILLFEYELWNISRERNVNCLCKSMLYLRLFYWYDILARAMYLAWFDLPIEPSNTGFHMEYAYSTHKTWSAARAALDDYLASGEVFESEFAGIRRRTTSIGFRFDVMLWG